MASFYILFGAFVGKEDYRFADQINFCAFFSVELYLKLPVAQTYVLVCIRQFLQALSV